MIRRVFLAFLVFGVTACGDDGTGLEDIAGTYTLQTVDGEGLPAVLDEIGTTFLPEVTGGSVTLNQDMTCSFTFSLRETEDGTVTRVTETAVGTYTFNNGAISLNFLMVDGFILSGSITGSTLRLTDTAGNVLIFEK